MNIALNIAAIELYNSVYRVRVCYKHAIKILNSCYISLLSYNI